MGLGSGGGIVGVLSTSISASSSCPLSFARVSSPVFLETPFQLVAMHPSRKNRRQELLLVGCGLLPFVATVFRRGIEGGAFNH